MQNRAAYVFILLSACCWGVLGVLTRFCLQDGLTPLEISFWRILIGASFFLVHAYATNTWRLHSIKDGLAFFLFGIFGIVAMSVSLFWVTQNGGVALGAVMLYTAPIWVAIAAKILRNEPLTLLKVAAIAISFTGIACISFTSDGEHTISLAVIGVGMISGLSYSTHFIFVKSYIMRYSAFAIYGFSMLFGALVILPFIDFMPKSAFDWSMLVAIAFISTYLAYWFYGEGLKYIEPTKASILVTLEPVVATICAWVVWDETFTFMGWVGGSLILTAVLLLIYGSRNTASVEEIAS